MLDDMLRRLAPAKLDGIEPWYPHASPRALTPALASAVRRRLAEGGIACAAYASGIADPNKDPYGAEETFQAARLLGAPLIAAHLPHDVVPRIGGLCSAYGIRVGFENGPEKSAGDIIGAIAGSGAMVGANLDTGNLAARGSDPVAAVRELGERIIHVHFKDVPAVGSHDCVALGTGIVDVKGVVRELKAVGYDGWLSIEVETGDRDPTDEIIASAETLRGIW
jgi:sugar phosphate isomerase/epimerase